MPYVDMLFWNTGMFEATLEGISERLVAECTAGEVADASRGPSPSETSIGLARNLWSVLSAHKLWDLG
jgi:hypothetical protein